MSAVNGLKGRRAFVTGGSGDIGGAIAVALANAGAEVTVSYVGHASGAAATVTRIREVGAVGHQVQLDQRDPASIERAVAEVTERSGGIDVLVNNAAWNIGIPFPDLDALDADTWSRVHETNIRGPYLLARACEKALKSNGGGHIVNIASTAGISPSGSSIAYACSKAALIHLTKCLAVALAPDVQVNCVAPGLVEGTRMANRLPEESADRARTSAVLGRVGSADDVASQVVSFCLSSTVTGQTIVVDGGMPAAMR